MLISASHAAQFSPRAARHCSTKPSIAERSAVGAVGMGNLISLTPGFSPVTESVQMKNRFNGLFGADGKFQVVGLKDDDPHSESHKLAMDFTLDEPMKIYPVSNLVNSPKTDDPRCIEPVRIDRDFFERQWWGDAES